MINKLSYIPKHELIRILSIEVSKLQKAELISLISRINTLYMINKAGSGHIGTSFSSMDLLSYIFLNFQITNAKNEDLFFSSKGMVYKMKVYKLPIGSPDRSRESYG